MRTILFNGAKFERTQNGSVKITLDDESRKTSIETEFDKQSWGAIVSAMTLNGASKYIDEVVKALHG